MHCMRTHDCINMFAINVKRFFFYSRHVVVGVWCPPALSADSLDAQLSPLNLLFRAGQEMCSRFIAACSLPLPLLPETAPAEGSRTEPHGGWALKSKGIC